MLYAHRVDNIRQAEEIAFRLVGADALMQTAAHGLADFVEELVPASDEILFLIGPGNNGGDGLFAAARLSQFGRNVHACVLDSTRVHQAGLAAATRAGVTFVLEPTDEPWVVDAVFGIGATPGLRDVAARWVQWTEETGARVISADVPSGVGVDDGTVPGVAFTAEHTVSFGANKICAVLGPASFRQGETHFIDLEIADGLGPAAVEILTESDGHLFATQLTPRLTDHKYSRGVLGVLAGSTRFPGAAHLCVMGALAGPCSMVRYLGDRQLADRVIDRAPEVVPQNGQVQAFVVGSGGEDSPGPIGQALALGVPLVVDASALKHSPNRFEVDTLLTPHAGELAQMLKIDREDVEADPLGSARTAAAQWNATVLLKGSRTLIVAPDGRIRVNHSGTPWLATAGAGDVLSGFAGALMAAGLSAFDAGSVAALVHGLAAERVNPQGPITASGVANELPRALAEFLGGARS